MSKKALKKPVTVVILSGGEARRMGGKDKGLVPFAGAPMILRTIETIHSLQGLVQNIIISTNNPERYTAFNLKTVKDITQNSLGPLAGIQAGLAAVKKGSVLVIPCDTPLLTTEPIVRLINTFNSHDSGCAVVHDGERMQTTLAMLDINQQPALDAYLQRGRRRLVTWYQEQGAIEVDCSDLKGVFININTPDDLKAAEKRFLEERPAT